MLSRFSSLLRGLSVILGSQSPRRQLILKENLGLNFVVEISKFEENIPKSSCNSPEDYVQQTCTMKCQHLIDSFKLKNQYPDVIITADTIVVYDNHILEKPSDRDHAIWMLNQLNGNQHKVLTAVTIATLRKTFKSTEDQPDIYDILSFIESTQVEFAIFSSECIESYVDTGEPFDKAGSYGIQSLGSSFVKGIHGCYFNVMGFPVHRFAKEFTKILLNKY